MFQPRFPLTNFSWKVARDVVAPSLPPMTVIVDTLGNVGLSPLISSRALMMFPRNVRKFLVSIFKKKAQLFFNMRCVQCKKKGLVCIPCSWCDLNSLCTSCIQLENHECSGILNKIQSTKEKLKQLNPKIESEKITKI